MACWRKRCYPCLNLEFVLRYVGISRDQSSHLVFNPSLVGPIFGASWEAAEMGRVVVELDFGS